MDYSSASHEEILTIADPIIDNIIKGSNEKDYEKLSKDFATVMMQTVPKEEFDRQMAESYDQTGNVKEEREFLSCVIRDSGVTVLWKGYFEKKNGEILIQLTLDEEDGKVKVVGAFIG